MLKRVFYVSAIAAGTAYIDVRAIISTSIVRNRRHDITGLLVASQSHFAQVLEGNNQNMSALMDLIQKDSHHLAIKVLVDRPIARRLFGRWSMAYLQRYDLAEDLRRLHSSADEALQRSVIKEMARASHELVDDL